MFIFGMVATQCGSGPGEGTSLVFGAGSLDDQIREFILSKIICNILEQSLIICSLIKEKIIELMDERLGAFRTEMVAMVVARSLTFRGFRACGAHEFFMKKDPIVTIWWLANMENAFCLASIWRR